MILRLFSESQSLDPRTRELCGTRNRFDILKYCLPLNGETGSDCHDQGLPWTRNPFQASAGVQIFLLRISVSGYHWVVLVSQRLLHIH